MLIIGLLAKRDDRKKVFHLIVCVLHQLSIRSSDVQHQVQTNLQVSLCDIAPICSRDLQLYIFEGKASRIVLLSTGSGGSISHGMDPDVNTEGKVTGSKFEPFHSIAGVQLLWDRKYGEKYAGSMRRRRQSRRKRRQRRRKWRRKGGGGKSGIGGG